MILTNKIQLPNDWIIKDITIREENKSEQYKIKNIGEANFITVKKLKEKIDNQLNNDKLNKKYILSAFRDIDDEYNQTIYLDILSRE